jgi:hypothetical protein
MHTNLVIINLSTRMLYVSINQSYENIMGYGWDYQRSSSYTCLDVLMLMLMNKYNYWNHITCTCSEGLGLPFQKIAPAKTCQLSTDSVPIKRNDGSLITCMLYRTFMGVFRGGGGYL